MDSNTEKLSDSIEFDIELPEAATCGSDSSGGILEFDIELPEAATCGSDSSGGISESDIELSEAATCGSDSSGRISEFDIELPEAATCGSGSSGGIPEFDIELPEAATCGSDSSGGMSESDTELPEAVICGSDSSGGTSESDIEPPEAATCDTNSSERISESDGEAIVQLKITLKYVNPPIWRRILVSSEDTFYDLHCNIQRAMGWDDLHSHQFTTRSSVLIVPIDPNDDDEVFYNFHMGPVLEERKTKLSTFLSKVGNSVVYLYDFMNGWQHKIVLEDILDKEPKTTYPKCVGGMRACPPEECGGVTGYHHLVQVWGNPQHEDYEALINNWLQDMCPNFDPDRFDPNIPFNPTFKF